MLACLCHIAAIFEPSLRDAACILDCIADSVFLTVMGCMNAQVALELNSRMSGVAPGGAPVCAELGEMAAEDKEAAEAPAVAAMDRSSGRYYRAYQR